MAGETMDMAYMGHTCDECNFYSISSGVCCKWNIERRSCGEDACNSFLLANDLKPWASEK